MNINILDKKAIQILKKYGNKVNPNINLEEFEYAKKKGVMYDSVEYTHDEFMELIISEYNKINKYNIINEFINSFIDNQLIKRSGLSAFAIMRTFKLHKFQTSSSNKLIEATTPCQICSSWYSLNTDPNIQIQLMYKSGGISDFLLSDIYFALKLTNLIKNENLNKDGIILFKRILNIIIDSEYNETPKSLAKKINKAQIIKSNEWQIQCILETLGYCGILHTEKYKGPYYEYINLATAPRKRHSSDWSYPVDWWTGNNGIDKEAFKYWFGTIDELSEFWDKN